MTVGHNSSIKCTLPELPLGVSGYNRFWRNRLQIFLVCPCEPLCMIL